MRQALREAFEREYAALFERHIPGAAIEILSWSVLVSTEAKLPARAGRGASRAGARAGRQRGRCSTAAAGGTIEVPVYRREALAPGSALPGPAIIAEDETSTYHLGQF